jgi:hypothetical protein
MALGDDIRGVDRIVLNAIIVLGLVTLGFGLLYAFTGWDFAKTGLSIVGPIAVIAVFAGLIRAWWPRNDV